MGKKPYAMFIELYMKGDFFLPALKGNNSCKTYNFSKKYANSLLYATKLTTVGLHTFLKTRG